MGGPPGAFRILDSRSGVMGHFEFECLAGRAYLTPTRDYRFSVACISDLPLVPFNDSERRAYFET